MLERAAGARSPAARAPFSCATRKKPKKTRAQQTTEEKAQSAALRKATRTACGTLSPNEKAKIHGVLPAAGGTTSGGTSDGGTPPAAPPTTTGH